jgi:hypothetical protein
MVERLRRVARHERESPRRGGPPALESSPPSRPPSPDVAAARVRAPGWRTGAWVGLGLGLACLLAVGYLIAAPEAEPTQKVGILTLPSVSSGRMEVEIGQEVAPPWKPPEVDAGMALPRDATPAPAATPTLPEESRVKTPQKKPVVPDDLKRLRGPGSPRPCSSAAPWP